MRKTLLVVISVFSSPPTLAEWVLTAPLPDSRLGTLTGALLPDGRAVFTSTDIYDPDTAAWSRTGPSSGGIAVPLLDGSILAVGWATSLLDPKTLSWTFVGTISRIGQTATALLDGRVLVTGGEGGPVDLAETLIFDQSTGWSAGPSMNFPRAYHTATLLRDGRVLVAGGRDSTAELFDPVTNTWSRTANMANPRYFHTATLLPDGNVLLAGGHLSWARCEIYNPTDGTWTQVADLINPREQHVAAALDDGRVLVAGGEEGGFLASSEIFDPSTRTWSFSGNMHNLRSNPLGVRLRNGSVLVAGGLFDYYCIDVACYPIASWTAEIFYP